MNVPEWSTLVALTMRRFAPANIILVYQESRIDWNDFNDIARRIVAKAPHINVHFVVPQDTIDMLPPHVWQLPTITVSFGATGRFVPLRGPVFANKAIPKLNQAALLERAGVATPKTALFQFGMQLSTEEWGEFVILKPASLSLSSSGEGIYLYRSRRLQGLRADDLPEHHFARRTRMLVQRLVDTGERPSKQRITTLFGEPFHWAYSENRAARPSLLASDELLDGAVVSTSASGQRTWSYREPSQEMFDFARRAAAVFPTTPLLGLDILSCNVTGKLYCLEVNAGGNVWHYSSSLAAEERARHPENFPNAQQKHWSFDKAAEILINKALLAAY